MMILRWSTSSTSLSDWQTSSSPDWVEYWWRNWEGKGSCHKLIIRKMLLIIGDTLLFICLIGLGVFSLLLNDAMNNEFYQFIVLIFLFLFLIGYNTSLGPIVWIYIAEILPEKGVSISVLVNWSCVFIITLTFPTLQANWGIYTGFFIFSITCFIG